MFDWYNSQAWKLINGYAIQNYVNNRDSYTSNDVYYIIMFWYVLCM